MYKRQHRISPARQDFSALRPCAYEDIARCADAMEQLDQASQVFADLPAYRAPQQVRAWLQTLLASANLDVYKRQGYEVTVVDGNNDQAKQTEQINTFITQGVDALIINPVMTSAAAQIVSTVKDAGIPTVLINREPTAEEMAPYDLSLIHI